MRYGDAAHLIEQAYAGTLIWQHKLDKDGVQAYIADGVMVVQGTSTKTLRDWFDNLNVGQRAREKGDSGAYWHKGWMRQARILYAFALLHKPKFIVGHSLGAAIAQIVGASLNIPTLCFASPRPYWGWKKVLHWEVVQNIIRKDDRVCYLPFKPKGLLKLVVGPWQFRHVGWVTTLTPAKPNPVVHHFE